MIEEARHRHPAMIVVGLVFLGGFLTIAAATVVSVLADPAPDPATLAVLALPDDIDVVDAHQTCSAVACDGEGAVIRSDGLAAADALTLVEEGLRDLGWRDQKCAGVGACLRWADLGAELVPWVLVDDEPGTAAMRANLDGMGVDQGSLVYLRVFRCGILTTCG